MINREFFAALTLSLLCFPAIGVQHKTGANRGLDSQSLGYSHGNVTHTDERGKSTTYAYRSYGDPGQQHRRASR